jgi:small-conductance mechanosensitive channel
MNIGRKFKLWLRRSPKLADGLSVAVVGICSVLAFGVDQQSGPASASNVVQFLNETISWYHQLDTERGIASSTADAIYAEQNRQIAEQVVRLSFEFARADDQWLSKSSSAQQAEAASGSGSSGMAQIAAKLDRAETQTQQEMAEARKTLETGTAAQRKIAQSSIGELQSELDLIDARRTVLRSMIGFAGNANASSGDLSSQIEALEHAVPAGLSGTSGSSSGTSGNAQNAAIPSAPVSGSGLWGLIKDLFAASTKIRTLNEAEKITDALIHSSTQLQAPVLNSLKTLAQQGDATMSQEDSTDPTVLGQQKSGLNALTGQFKIASAAFLPLKKQAILLDIYKRNLTGWKAEIKNSYSGDLKSLLLRLGSLAILIGIVVGLAQLWRRAIFRYVHDTHRRYQMLLLQRIALWLGIVLIIAFTFSTELGSLATFAGLLTAGVAVALQNVILSVAGYFFLMGKYGVSVGDRVEISGVTGDVVDVGLVRLHVMELQDNGTSMEPTGRVVAFSNSFVFQPTAGVFKQISGTNFFWHEISLTFAADSDRHMVQERIQSAVAQALGGYHSTLETQRLRMERNLTFTPEVSLQPNLRFRLGPGGYEVKIRYAVDSDKAVEMDERLAHELIQATEKDPQLKMVGSDIPALRRVQASPSPEVKAG